jgi:hypothetical protein
VLGLAKVLDEDDIPPKWKLIIAAHKAAKQAKALKSRGIRKSSATRRM